MNHVEPALLHKWLHNYKTLCRQAATLQEEILSECGERENSQLLLVLAGDSRVATCDTVRELERLIALQKEFLKAARREHDQDLVRAITGDVR